MVVQVEKKFLVFEHFSTPGGVINTLQLLEALSRKVQPRPIASHFRQNGYASATFFLGALWHDASHS